MKKFASRVMQSLGLERSGKKSSWMLTLIDVRGCLCACVAWGLSIRYVHNAMCNPIADVKAGPY